MSKVGSVEKVGTRSLGPSKRAARGSRISTSTLMMPIGTAHEGPCVRASAPFGALAPSVAYSAAGRGP